MIKSIITLLIFTLSMYAELGFKNIQINISEEELKKSVNENLFCANIKGARACMTTKEYKYTIVGIENSFPIQISLKDNKVKLIKITSDYVNFERISMAYQSKYGKPSFEETKILQNRMGVTFESKELGWDLEDGKILIKERAKKIDEMGVYITSKDFNKATKIEKQKLLKKYSDDI